MDDRPRRPGLVALLGRVLRWKPSSYWQICLLVAVGYLFCATVFWLVDPAPRRAEAGFVGFALPWLGAFTGFSLGQWRRTHRSGGRVSEAKPFGRLPRSR